MSDQTSCRSCGTTFPDTAAFCPQCGTPHAQPPAGDTSAASSGGTGGDDRTRVDVPTQVAPSYDTPNPGGAPPSWSTPPPSEAPAWTGPPVQDQASWSTPPAPPPPQPQAGWGSAPPGPSSWPQGPAAASPGYAGGSAKAQPDKSVIGGILAVVGGITAIVSAFLVWIKVSFGGVEGSGKGWDATPDAKIVLGIGIAAIVVGAALFLNRHVVLRLLLLAAGVGVLAVAARDMLDVSSFGKDIGATSHSIGAGLYVVVVAGVVLLAAGAASFAGKRSPSSRPM